MRCSRRRKTEGGWRAFRPPAASFAGHAFRALFGVFAAACLVLTLGACAAERNRELGAMGGVVGTAGVVAPAVSPASGVVAPASPPATAPSPAPASSASSATPVRMGVAGAGAGGVSTAAEPMPTAVEGPAAGPLPSSPEPRPSQGCGGGSLQPGESMGSIDSAGGMRTYILFVPSGYDGDAPLPLVLDLHGLTSNATQQAQISGFRPQAETESYVYLAPNGLDNMWSDRGADSMDITFIRELLADVEARGCIDLKRVYSTGCSNGGSMTNLLMCSAEDIIAAVAPVCGTTFFDLESECMLDRPISTMLVIGRQDTLNCWESGGGMGGLGVTCVKDYQAAMVKKNGCKGQPTATVSGVCESVDQCDGGTEVVICGPSIGHVAYSTSDMNVAKEAWTFLKKFYLP